MTIAQNAWMLLRSSTSDDRAKRMTDIVPGYSAELRERIAHAIDLSGGVATVAKQLGVSKNTPGRWRDGHTKIPLHAITQLAETAGVSRAWLAFGDEARPLDGPSDFDLIEDAAETVIEVAVGLGHAIDSAVLAKAIRDRAERLSIARRKRGQPH